ncbi:MAG: heparin lyase I family protein [Kiritimatiellae bacterium]|nr:heparin lyase I family protein [Kiritimatiellia bacterium]
MPARAGACYLRSYTQLSGNHYRSEVIPKVVRQYIGQEYWVGISIYIPSAWYDDGLTLDSPLVFQFHHNSWSGVPDMELPLNIHIDPKESDAWRVKQAGPNGQGIVYVYEASYLPDKGKWTDWVFNLRFSPGSDGFLKIWKDGTLVLARTGSNYAAGHENHPANIQFGLYNWGYRDTYNAGRHATSSRTIYHDEFRVGDANSSYAEVAPGGVPDTAPAAPRMLRVTRVSGP